MRKITAIMVMILTAALLLTGCAKGAKLSEKFDEETVKAEAMKAVEYFNQRDYASILAMGSEELKAALTEEAFAQAVDPYLDKNGAFMEITKTAVMGNTDKETGDEYGGVVMVGKYENGKIQFVISFDEEMKLVQFVIR